MRAPSRAASAGGCARQVMEVEDRGRGAESHARAWLCRRGGAAAGGRADAEAMALGSGALGARD